MQQENKIIREFGIQDATEQVVIKKSITKKELISLFVEPA